MSKSKDICVQIREMIRRDMPEVLDIEAEGFEFPWLEEDFIRCLRQRNCVGMVAEHKDRVAGFMIYELHKNRIHVLNFAVATRYQRRAIGTQMVFKLQAKLSAQGCSRLTVNIAERNLVGQRFFRGHRFQAVLPILRGADHGEDAYHLECREVISWQCEASKSKESIYAP